MIHIRAIGVSLESLGSVRSLHDLETHLARLHALGFTLIEINPFPFALIINGELRARQLANFSAVLRNFDLRYTIHGLMRLNLAYDPQHDLCQRIMRSQIELCRAIGATRLVYHSGLQALDAVRHGVRPSLLTDEELRAGAEREVMAFRELAPLAADAGVIIGMENGDPHQWEYTILAGFGRPRSDLIKHHARLQVDPIVHQLEAIDHPNVGMTLDVGHLHIAAHDMGFDYLDAVRVAAPWVRHLHFSDNYGRLDRGFDKESDRWAFGEADMHMPPGWGIIPYADLLPCLDGYEGYLILEMQSGFRDYLGEAREAMERILGLRMNWPA
jgi:sugar phosphate isomerase/epimerase